VNFQPRVFRDHMQIELYHARKWDCDTYLCIVCHSHVVKPLKEELHRLSGNLGALSKF
jgi:cbb3-type cytochrome oxidase cytochrome c subunit